MGKPKSNIIQNGTTSSLFDVKIHYDEASEPYAVTLDEETYYYIRNAVGDVKGLINADTGEYVYALNTSAYGVLNFIEPDLTFDTSSLIPNPTEAILEAMKKVLLQFCLCLPSANTYKGYSYDVFTGLYYLQSRYYDPEVGRFINADDVDYLGVGNRPLSYNLFAYCENNPVNNSDPIGTFTVRRWMIAFPLDALFMATPLGAWFAPVKYAAKKFGISVVKKSFSSNIYKMLNWLIKNIHKIISKVIKAIKSVKLLKQLKFIQKLSATNITGGLIGFALIKTPVYKLTNLLFKNIDIFLSLGGFVSGFLDYIIDKKVNNKIWVI